MAIEDFNWANDEDKVDSVIREDVSDDGKIVAGELNSLRDKINETKDVVNVNERDSKTEFSSISEATTYWGDDTIKPTDGKHIFIEGESFYYKWDSGETSKVVVTDREVITSGNLISLATSFVKKINNNYIFSRFVSETETIIPFNENDCVIAENDGITINTGAVSLVMNKGDIAVGVGGDAIELIADNTEVLDAYGDVNRITYCDYAPYNKGIIEFYVDEESITKDFDFLEVNLLSSSNIIAIYANDEGTRTAIGQITNLNALDGSETKEFFPLNSSGIKAKIIYDHSLFSGDMDIHARLNNNVFNILSSSSIYSKENNTTTNDEIVLQSLLTGTYIPVGTDGKYYNTSGGESTYTGAFYSAPVKVVSGKTLVYTGISFGSNAAITYTLSDGSTVIDSPISSSSVDTFESDPPTNVVSAIFSSLSKDDFSIKYDSGEVAQNNVSQSDFESAVGVNVNTWKTVLEVGQGGGSVIDHTAPIFKSVNKSLKIVNSEYNFIGFANTSDNITTKQKETSEGTFTVSALEKNDVIIPLYSGEFTNFNDADVSNTPITVPTDFENYILVRADGLAGVGWRLATLSINEDLTRLITTQSLLNDTFQKSGTSGRFYNGSGSAAYGTGFYSDPVLLKSGETIIFTCNSFGSNVPMTFVKEDGSRETYAPSGNPNLQTLTKVVPENTVYGIFSTLVEDDFSLKYQLPTTEEEGQEIVDYNHTDMVKFDVVNTGDNLINPQDLIPNKAVNKSTGLDQTASNWWMSPYVTVESNTRYIVLNFTNYAGYDSDGNFVSGADWKETQITINSIPSRTIVTPANVVSMRVAAGANANAAALKIILAKYFENGSHSGFSFDFDKDLFPHLAKPFAGEYVSIVGDSYVAQGRFVYTLLQTTGLRVKELSGNSGQPIAKMPYYLSQMKHSIKRSRLIIINAGTNDYGVQTASGSSFGTIPGTVSETPRTAAQIIAGGSEELSTSIITAVKECVAIIDYLANDIDGSDPDDNFTNSPEILFVCEPERAGYGNMYGLFPPALNDNGLNMEVVSSKIKEAANNIGGVQVYDFRSEAWRLSQVLEWCLDGLHPDQDTGGKRMGIGLGKFINRTYYLFS